MFLEGRGKDVVFTSIHLVIDTHFHILWGGGYTHSIVSLKDDPDLDWIHRIRVKKFTQGEAYPWLGRPDSDPEPFFFIQHYLWARTGAPSGTSGLFCFAHISVVNGFPVCCISFRFGIKNEIRKDYLGLSC